MKIFEKEYRETIEKLLLDIKKTKKLYGIKNKNIETLKKIYSIQLKKYNAARISLPFLIDTENSIIEERMDELSLKAELIKYNLDYELFIYNGEDHE